MNHNRLMRMAKDAVVLLALAAVLPSAGAQTPGATGTLALPAHVVQGIAAAASAERAQRAALEAAAKASRARGSASGPASSASGSQAVGKVVQGPGTTPVQAEVQTHKVVIDARGKERFEPASGLFKGDIVQFTGIFTNRNAIGIRFDPRLSVPPNTTLVPGSIQPASGQLTTMGGAPVVAWTVPHLPPNTQVKASLRVRYEGLPPEVASAVGPAASSAASTAAAAASAPASQPAAPVVAPNASTSASQASASAQ
jgi:hypothetical protein